MVEASPARLFSPAFVALTLADLAYFTAAGILLALTPLFVTGPLSSGKAAVGVAMGAFSVTTVLLRPWTGRWADERGRRSLLVGGALMFTVVVAGHLAVTGLVWLVVLRMLLGAAEALFFVAAFATLADLAPPGRTGAALSFNSLALYAGVALGPVVAQVLLRVGGFTAGWLGAVGFAAAATALATRVPETLDRRSEDGARHSLVHRPALLPGLALFTGVAAMSGFFAFAVLRAQQVGIERWSVVLLLFGTVIVLCRIVFADLPDRVPPVGLAASALAVLAGGAALLALVPTASGLLVGSAVAAVGVAFLTPAIFAAVFASTGSSERGAASGTLSVFIDLGLGGGPVLVGFVAAGYGIGGGLVAAAALAGLGAVLLAVRALAPGATPRERSA
ncbi:MFS transporter [Nocardioides donggukensis]|uniref:MFS transporter n=1 Tax=Nocardioides donggukensis TaxID=2774019 RepID=A0A927K2R8_9ACTN|nr:MFS transporter [Nocardioides donggukensis]MBD8868822.1 MFS transporter [Nocardioides donggukensis]